MKRQARQTYGATIFHDPERAKDASQFAHSYAQPIFSLHIPPSHAGVLTTGYQPILRTSQIVLIRINTKMAIRSMIRHAGAELLFKPFSIDQT